MRHIKVGAELQHGLINNISVHGALAIGLLAVMGDMSESFSAVLCAFTAAALSWLHGNLVFVQAPRGVQLTVLVGVMLACLASLVFSVAA